MMGKRIGMPEPAGNWGFVDTHCHVPWVGRPVRGTPSPEKQLEAFKDAGGRFMVVSAIDWESTVALHEFASGHDEVFLACGMAPQTVTYTPPGKYKDELAKWMDFIDDNLDAIVAFGEVGLDFHHAKTLQKRLQQVEGLDRILAFIKPKGKPLTLHVRNAGPGDVDKDHPAHPANAGDAATRKLLELLQKHGFEGKDVLFHCYSGPSSMNDELVEGGFTFSVPSSAFSFPKWYNVSKSIPVDRLVTETDSPYQHPTIMRPGNMPVNARHAVAAIAHARGITQEAAAAATVARAKEFFKV